jgi:hypothetical protein
MPNKQTNFSFPPVVSILIPASGKSTAISILLLPSEGMMYSCPADHTTSKGP